jgi:hypothetical protein
MVLASRRNTMDIIRLIDGSCEGKNSLFLAGGADFFLSQNKN